MSSPVPSPSPQDVLEIERPEQLKALGHPLRLKVLQVLGDAGRPLTNRELAAQLSVDPGHLHFHVRMLHRAGLIELAASDGREKPYRPVAKHFKIGPRDSGRRSRERGPGGPASRAPARLRSLRGGRRVPKRTGAHEAGRRDGAPPAQRTGREVDRARGRVESAADDHRCVPPDDRAGRYGLISEAASAMPGAARRCDGGARASPGRAPCRRPQRPRGTARASRTTPRRTPPRRSTQPRRALR